VYAEDATKGFLPSTGKVSHLAFPEAERFATGPVRVDAGVAQGSEITPFYDPMIAKLIVHGPSREAALARLETALCHCQVAGVTTNIDFLLALAQHEGFAAGDVDTGLIDRDFDALTTQPQAGAHAISLASVLALDLLSERGNGPWNQASGWRAWGQGAATIRMRLGEADLEQSVTFEGDQTFRLEGAANVICTVKKTGNSAFAVLIDGMRLTLHAVKSNQEVVVFQNGATYRFHVPDPLVVESDDARAGDVLIAPMPGLVRLVSAEAGGQVSKGDPLLVLEAMKMEHTLRAPRDGTVEAVLTEAGAQVSDGAILLRLEEVSDA
jgi:3-methylcrotonyl-CoA carboxylase alpha subunit